MENVRDPAVVRGIAFVRQHARPLDKALLEYRLGAGEKAAVLNELARFQCEDGGFGNGLEPDLPAPASTAIVTSIALRHLCDIGALPSEAIIGRALAWLASSFDWKAGVWPIINKNVDLAPHAFWWAYGDDLAQTWNGFRYNPTAELLGSLYHYRAGVAPELLKAAEETLLKSLASHPPANAYDLRCAARLLDAKELPDRVRGPLQALLLAEVRAHDASDPHLAFLEIAPSPQSMLAKAFPERIAPALAALRETQQPDGGWRPFWDWSSVDEAAWKKAERDWRGVLTRQSVEILTAYGER